MPRIRDYLEFIQGESTTHPAIVWNDINFGSPSIGTGTFAAVLTISSGIGGIALQAYSSTGLHQGFVVGEILHDYKEGSDISFHIHWVPHTTSIGNVQWNIEYSWQNTEDSSNIMPAPSTITALGSATGTPFRAYVTGFSEIGGTGKKIGSQIAARIYRDPTTIPADTYVDAVSVLSVGIHYQTDSVGSRQKFIK